MQLNSKFNLGQEVFQIEYTDLLPHGKWRVQLRGHITRILITGSFDPEESYFLSYFLSYGLSGMDPFTAFTETELFATGKEAQNICDKRNRED